MATKTRRPKSPLVQRAEHVLNILFPGADYEAIVVAGDFAKLDAIDAYIAENGITTKQFMNAQQLKQDAQEQAVYQAYVARTR